MESFLQEARADSFERIKMPYAMHRVFCAAPGELDEELQSFFRVLAHFNETEAMPRGILLVSVALPVYSTDKRGYQGVVNENIRACRYYIQVLEESWGPPQRNFEREYALAQKCLQDPELPMQDVALFFKKPLLPHRVEPDIAELKRAAQPSREFETIQEFERDLRTQLSAWLQAF